MENFNQSFKILQPDLALLPLAHSREIDRQRRYRRYERAAGLLLLVGGLVATYLLEKWPWV